MAKTNLPRSRRRKVAAVTPKCKQFDDRPLTVRFGQIAHALTENNEAKIGSIEEQVAFMKAEALAVSCLLTSLPLDLDHIATLLALARGHTPLSDCFDEADHFKLLYPADELHKRLLVLDQAIVSAIHGLCIRGAALHPVTEHYSTEAERAAWHNATSLHRR